MPRLIPVSTKYYSSYSPSLLLLIYYVIQKSGVQDHKLQGKDQGQDQDEGQDQDFRNQDRCQD